MINNEDIQFLKMHLESNNGFAKQEALKALAMIERLQKENAALQREITSCNAENERLRKNYTLPKSGFFNLLCGALVYTKTLEEYNEFKRAIKAEARKEFAELIKKAFPSIAAAVEYIAKKAGE